MCEFLGQLSSSYVVNVQTGKLMLATSFSG